MTRLILPWFLLISSLNAIKSLLSLDTSSNLAKLIPRTFLDAIANRFYIPLSKFIFDSIEAFTFAAGASITSLQSALIPPQRMEGMSWSTDGTEGSFLVFQTTWSASSGTLPEVVKSRASEQASPLFLSPWQTTQRLPPRRN
jgi:hypothetical protein